MLTPDEVLEEAINRKIVPPHDSAEYIKENFSMLVEELQIDAYEIYLEAEEREGVRAIREDLKARISPGSSTNDVIEEAANMFNELDRFFLSLTQSRKPRAGKAFEVILKTLFTSLGYPFDEQQVINGKPDFLMPGREYYDRNAMDCIIFTAKRTLRERWRQIVTEGTRGLGFYLATIDEKVSNAQLGEMRDHRIYLVMPDAIKSRISHYSAADNVISFEEFFQHHLDPAIERWRARDII
jgi:hypothetical protein